MHRVWIQSLVGERRSHMSHGTAKKKVSEGENIDLGGHSLGWSDSFQVLLRWHWLTKLNFTFLPNLELFSSLWLQDLALSIFHFLFPLLLLCLLPSSLLFLPLSLQGMIKRKRPPKLTRQQLWKIREQYDTFRELRKIKWNGIRTKWVEKGKKETWSTLVGGTHLNRKVGRVGSEEGLEMDFSPLQPPDLTATAWLLPGVVHGGEGRREAVGSYSIQDDC